MGNLIRCGTLPKIARVRSYFELFLLVELREFCANTRHGTHFPARACRFGFWNCVAACRSLALPRTRRCCAPHSIFPPSTVDTVCPMGTSSCNLCRNVESLRGVEPQHARVLPWTAATAEKGFSAVGQTQLIKFAPFFFHFSPTCLQKQPRLSNQSPPSTMMPGAAGRTALSPKTV